MNQQRFLVFLMYVVPEEDPGGSKHVVKPPPTSIITEPWL